jgi:drug/metabolite transporter (DMT)-like permease
VTAPGGLGPRRILLLVLLTLTWGLNWPVMKAGVAEFPPLSFRALSMWLGLPLLWAIVRMRGTPLAISRRHWRELGWLTLTNMLGWHVLTILSVQALSSGRAAILGYTMPIWSALWGFARYGQRLTARQLAGIGAAALGVTLLLWHELAHIAGHPLAALGMLGAAAVWALGTQQMRHTRMTETPTLAIVLWMTALTTVASSLLALAFEAPRWHAPSDVTWAAIVINAVAVFAFAQVVWLVLARDLPPVASTMSIMLVPVLGTLSGAWWLHEQLHWQDGAAILLLLAAIAAVMWPARRETRAAMPRVSGSRPAAPPHP